MTPLIQAGDEDALATYEAFAPFYDRYTSDHGHDAWMADLERILRTHGLRGKRVLDVACGTGRSLMPLVRRGYRVTGCDRSPAMVERARANLGRDARVVVADMRDLPWRERFDAATCVDDAVNYLLSLGDVVAALGSIRDALVPRGLFVFDVNAIGAYRGAFADEIAFEAGGTSFRWRGESSADMEPGALVSAVTEVLDDDGSPLVSARHVQRHYSISQLRLACGEAGLECVRFWGEVPGRGLVEDADEEQASKIVCLARRT